LSAGRKPEQAHVLAWPDPKRRPRPAPSAGEMRIEIDDSTAPADRLATDAARPPSRAGEAWRLAAALAAYALLAVVYLRPIWRVFATRIAPDPFDPIFNLYVLKWVAHEAHRGFAGFWDAPFFYPARGVLAYSDHLLGPGLAAAVIAALVPAGMPRWLPSYNFLFFSSFAATGLSACFVLRRGRLGWAAAWLGGAMYAFSPFRWDQLSHLQILLMQCIPVTLWSFDQMLVRPNRGRAALFLLFYLLHLSGGCYLAYMIHIPLAVLLANRFPELLRRRRWRAELPLLGGAGLLAAGAAAALFGEYWRVARSAGLHWGTGPAQSLGASALSYLTPSASNLYSHLFPQHLFRSENSLFPGWLAAGLALLGARDLWRRYRRPPLGRLSAARRLALLSLPALACAGWLAGEVRTWSRPDAPVHPSAALLRWIPGTGYAAGLLLVALGIGGWLLLRRRWLGGWPLRWEEIDPWERGLLAAGAATAALSFPIFFLPATQILPGLSAMRVPARFDAFTSFTIVWLAAAALDRRLAGKAGSRGAPGIAGLPAAAASAELPPAATSPGLSAAAAAAPGGLPAAGPVASPAAGRRAGQVGRVGRVGFGRRGLPAGAGGPGLLALILALLLVELFPRPIGWVGMPDEDDFPDVYSWIAEQPDIHALLEVPLADPSMPSSYLVDISYMYFESSHWKPLVNGYSAHAPLAVQRLRQRCCWPGPDNATLEELRSWGVTHLLIHRSELPAWQRARLDPWAAAARAELLYAGGGDRVYRIARPAPAPRWPAVH
jgi:hypothetical protein